MSERNSPHKKPKPRLLVFDGDDTLWSTMPLYTAAKRRFARSVAAEFALPQSKVIEILDQVDERNVKRFGFARRRFPTSMREAYDVIAQSVGTRPNPATRREMYAIGAAVFRQPPHIIDDATRIVRTLKRSGFEIVLCTKGDRAVQHKRIHAIGLGDLFDRIYVVADKGEAEFRAILERHHIPPREACSIGNSLRSDINPALRIGMRAVWIPAATWSFESERLMRSRRVEIVKRLSGVLALLTDNLQHS